jgi:type I restriction enzyme S subunit
LEETAQTIYKQWFVDFEFPDENGKEYKSNGGEMVESEMGEVPKRWKVGKIGDYVETLGGGTPSTEEIEYWENGDIFWYSPTDITNNNGIFISDSEKKITKEGLQRSSAKLFPAFSLMMTSRATIGKLGINTKEASTNQGFITLIPNEQFSVYFLYDWLKTQLDEITNLASGSTFPEISKTDFRNLSVIVPIYCSLTEYKKKIVPLFNLIHVRKDENEIIEKLKELLLAKMAKK